eukprot:9478177-Prorocentrum_lima.AAC.1
MTSSLVGSEMCIRDSLLCVSLRGVLVPVAESRGHYTPCREERPRINAPVSYTHLTLPTICSV